MVVPVQLVNCVCVCVCQAQTGQTAEGARRCCQRAAARRPVSVMVKAQVVTRGAESHSLCVLSGTMTSRF